MNPLIFAALFVAAVFQVSDCRGNTPEIAALTSLSAEYDYEGGPHVKFSASGKIGKSSGDVFLIIQKASLVVDGKALDSNKLLSLLQKCPGIKLETITFLRDEDPGDSGEAGYRTYLAFEFRAYPYVGSSAYPGESRHRAEISFDRKGTLEIEELGPSGRRIPKKDQFE